MRWRRTSTNSTESNGMKTFAELFCLRMNIINKLKQNLIPSKILKYTSDWLISKFFHILSMLKSVLL